MQLSTKTLEKLREIINGDESSNRMDYRSGPKLVAFFNNLGFKDVYTQGFPSRWMYTDEKLQKINGTPELDKCIRNTFAVVNYIERITELDALIADFNQYLAFDKWAIVRDNNTITFKRLNKVVVDSGKSKTSDLKEDEFLKMTFNVDVDSLGLDSSVSKIIKLRLKEVETCINSEAPLASILLIGSIMEGILLGMATTYPRQFNQALSAPKDKDTGKVRVFPSWTLNNYIDVAFEAGLLKQDVKKFSHVVRDFRNYIHPYEQMSAQFSPDKQTALICFQVLKAAISQIGTFCKNQQEGYQK
ncbi:MAG: hypothetical protein BWX81_01467 [Spirochaetes bacterium ADurb.Bin110]|jgi:hypothetical protein|nr:MAG: hypothetical protein BWX81_01467 [Spirochaetes bacterium ADurb.Bin110]